MNDFMLVVNNEKELIKDVVNEKIFFSFII